MRLRVAEVAAAVVVISSFLPWTVEDDRTLRGVQIGEGQTVVLTAVVTIVMIRLGSRLAWFAAGFSAAVLWRQWFEDEVGLQSLGPLLGALAASVAVGLLIWINYYPASSEWCVGLYCKGIDTNMGYASCHKSIEI